MSRVSVALCTFQGARFLEAQLASIALQSRIPDELVVCDDHSTDGTLRILEKFKEEAPFPMRLYPNPVNLGFAKNFEKAISRCEGELIFLADQDDDWEVGKISRVLDEFDKHPDIDLVFSDARVVDSGGFPLRRSLWSCFDFRFSRQRKLKGSAPWEVLLDRNVVTGCCMALRTRLVEWAFPLPEGIEHDAWLALVASFRGGLRALPDKLLEYRIHENNAVGLQPRDLSGGNLWGRFREDGKARISAQKGAIARLSKIKARMTEKPLGEKSRQGLLHIQDAMTHRGLRADLPKSFLARAKSVGREFLRGAYGRHGGSFLSVMADLFRGP